MNFQFLCCKMNMSASKVMSSIFTFDLILGISLLFIFLWMFVWGQLSDSIGFIALGSVFVLKSFFFLSKRQQYLKDDQLISKINCYSILRRVMLVAIIVNNLIILSLISLQILVLIRHFRWIWIVMTLLVQGCYALYLYFQSDSLQESALVLQRGYMTI